MLAEKYDRPDEDKREALRIALPLVLATVFGRTVWAANIQTAGSTSGSGSPSNSTTNRSLL